MAKSVSYRSTIFLKTSILGYGLELKQTYLAMFQSKLALCFIHVHVKAVRSKKFLPVSKDTAITIQIIFGFLDVKFT